MRSLIAIPLLLLASACSVETDRPNGQTTIGFDENVVANTADNLRNAARDAGNELERAGQGIRNEVRDVDVDVDVRRGDDATRNKN